MWNMVCLSFSYSSRFVRSDVSSFIVNILFFVLSVVKCLMSELVLLNVVIVVFEFRVLVLVFVLNLIVSEVRSRWFFEVFKICDMCFCMYGKDRNCFVVKCCVGFLMSKVCMILLYFLVNFFSSVGGFVSTMFFRSVFLLLLLNGGVFVVSWYMMYFNFYMFFVVEYVCFLFEYIFGGVYNGVFFVRVRSFSSFRARAFLKFFSFIILFLFMSIFFGFMFLCIILYFLCMCCSVILICVA